MDSSSSNIDRETTTPFYLKLFYKNGAFHRPDEFTPTSEPTDHVAIYTWQSCSLRELSQLLLTALPSLLPQPYIGTRLSFRLTFPDTRSASASLPGRYMTKELGSVVLGEGGPGIVADDEVGEVLNGPLDGEPEKTLQDAKFVIGDFVCCAVMPPLENGRVAPPIGRGGDFGRGDFRGSRDGGFGRSGDGFRRARGGSRGGFGQNVLMSEWSRGEKVPEGPSGSRGRGYGGRGRGW